MLKISNTQDFRVAYSEVFEQLRIYSQLQDNFYLWLSPISRIDSVDDSDKTLQMTGPHIEKSGSKICVRFGFKSSLWQYKEAIYEITPAGIEYYIRIKGRNDLGRLYFNTGIFREDVIGSVPGFDYYTPGCPNFLGKERFFSNEFFSISVANDTSSWGLALNSGPFLYSFVKDGAPHCLWAGLIVKPGQNLFDGFDFNYAPKENLTAGDHILNTQSFSLDYSGHLRVDGKWESPHLYFSFSKNYAASIEDYCRILESRGAIVTKQENNFDWWHKPIFCGWHEQCALSYMNKRDSGLSFAQIESGTASDFCTQKNYEHFLDIVKDKELEIGTVIIDAKWQKLFGCFEEDKEKWPAMRNFIDLCHKNGMKVILWLRAWGTTEGLDEDECMKVNGKASAIDPTSPKYIERVKNGMRYMLSTDPGCLDGDGVKIDATNVIPIGRNVKTHGEVYGFELQHRYFELMYKSATAIKADACVSLFTANPYFRDVGNSIRLGDNYSVYGRPVDTVRQRARVVRIAMAGKPIDTDGTFRFSLEEDFVKEFHDQIKEGIPCLYQVEHVFQNRGFVKSMCRKITDAEYAEMKRVTDEYNSRTGL